MRTISFFMNDSINIKEYFDILKHWIISSLHTLICTSYESDQKNYLKYRWHLFMHMKTWLIPLTLHLKWFFRNETVDVGIRVEVRLVSNRKTHRHCREYNFWKHVHTVWIILYPVKYSRSAKMVLISTWLGSNPINITK